VSTPLPKPLNGEEFAAILKRPHVVPGLPNVSAYEVLALLATIKGLQDLVRDLAPRCRYIDRKEAEAFKAKVDALASTVSREHPE